MLRPAESPPGMGFSGHVITRLGDARGQQLDERDWALQKRMNLRRTSAKGILWLGFGCMGLSTGSAVSQSPSLYAEAQQAFAEKQYEQAAKLFAGSVAAQERTSNPKAADALLMEGKSLVNIENFAEAEVVLKSYAEQNPRSSAALYLLGYVLQRENKPRESLEVFTRAAAITPPLADDLKIVALDYVLISDYPDAIRWLKKAVEQDPRNAEAWYDLGRSQMNQGDFVAAQQSFDRVLTLSPQDVKALNNMGLAYEAQNRISDALHAYERAIASQQGAAHPSEQPLLNYGTLLISQNRTEDAIHALEPAVKAAPKDAKCHEALSRAYLQEGRLADARQEMEEAAALDPENPRLHYQLGRLYRQSGMADRAKAELDLSAKLYASHSTPEQK